MQTTSGNAVKRRFESQELPADVVSCIYCGPEEGADTSDDQPLVRGCTIAICTFKRADSVKEFMDSLAGHDRKPERLLLVDASPDDETERLVDQYEKLDQLAQQVFYYRVEGIYKTLTCSRNFALRKVNTDLVVYFDDDIELLPHCMEELESTHRQLGDEVMGVGALIENERKSPGKLWRLRKSLRMISNLNPGTYSRSGMSVPWNFLSLESSELVEGDWLRGCAMMWRTAAAKETQFYEGFGGHSQSEDLDFSLRAATHGRLFVNAKARVLHFPNTAGRPDSFMMGYTGMRNAYHIHRHCLVNRKRRDAMWFFYAWGLDTFIRLLGIAKLRNTMTRITFFQGRFCFVWQLFTGNKKARLDPDHSDTTDDH